MKDKKCICIINGEVKGEYTDEHVLGVQKRANELGYLTVTYSMLSADTLETNNDESIYSYINFDEYDGVVFNEYSFSAHKHIAHGIEGTLKKSCKLPKVTIGSSDVSNECFFNDSEADFEAITDHLITIHECTKIYFLGGSHGDPKHRIKGFQNSIRKHGLDPNECIPLYGGYWVECAENFVKDLGDGNIEKPDAVVCVTDIVANALIKECFNMGLRVPEDILICGCNGYSCAFNSLLPITTFPVNVKEVGERAMNRLHELITGETVVFRKKPPLSIILGKSCGCSTPPPSNLRHRLAEADKGEKLELAYKNSRLEEKLVVAKTVDEIRSILKDNLYLVPNAEFFSWNVVDNSGSVTCQYLTKFMVFNSAPVKKGKLFPEHIVLQDEILNYYVVPLVYNGEELGYVVVGYAKTAVIDHNLKRFCHCLALGTMLIMQKEPIVEDVNQTVTEEISEEPKSEKEYFDKKSNIIFGKKQEMMHKLKIDNILYFEAMGKRVTAVTANGEYEVSSRLFELENALEELQFMRVSKSTVVNISKVILIKEEEDRSVSAYFTPQIGVRVSRTYVKEFRKRMGVSQKK